MNMLSGNALFIELLSIYNACVRVYTHARTLYFAASCKYLGHVMCNDLCDKAVIQV